MVLVKNAIYYHLLSIGKGRKHLSDYMNVVKPEYERYTGIVKTMKEKNSERKALLQKRKQHLSYS